MSSATVFPTATDVMERVQREPAGSRIERRYLADPSPWRRRNLLVSAALLLAGGIGLFVGWYGISREETFREQTGWLVLSIGATVLAVVGLSVTIIAAFRAVRRGQRQIAADLSEQFGLSPQRDAGRETAPAATAAQSRVTLVGLNRVHLPSCPMVEGKAVEPLDAARSSDRTLTACGVCQP